MVWVNCISPDTLISLSNGKKIKISDLFEKNAIVEKNYLTLNAKKRKTKHFRSGIEILTICENEICFADITGISKIKVDQKKIFEIETISGRKITCTGKHEFLTEKSLNGNVDEKLIGVNGLIPASNLNLDDNIAIFDRIGISNVSNEAKLIVYDIGFSKLLKF